VYIGLLPVEPLAAPGAVLAPVLRGVVLVDLGVPGPPERRFICFVRAMAVGCGAMAVERRQSGAWC